MTPFDYRRVMSVLSCTKRPHGLPLGKEMVTTNYPSTGTRDRTCYKID